MAHLQLHYSCPTLVKQVGVDIVLPDPRAKGPFAVMYLLHGLSDDHTAWMRRSSIERHVGGLPLIVVMPDGGRSFYCDAKAGPAYETAIIKDLVNYIDEMFYTRAEKSGRCIGGLSMGGYGALKFALRYPHMFCSAHSHSGAVDFAHDNQRWTTPELDAEFARIVGLKPQGSHYDLFTLAKKVDRNLLPALRIDCGVNDFLIEQNREFHEYLTKIDLPHEYEEFPGEHNWGYWDLHIQEAIAFHAKHLKLA